MYTQFTTVFIFLLIGACIVPLMLLAGKILRPHKPSKEKLMTYECGEISVGSSWIQFNLRFYVIAILFLVFDVEAVFMFPIAAVFKHWIANPELSNILIFLEITVFVVILLVGFAYCWYKGDLEWIRAVAKNPPIRKS